MLRRAERSLLVFTDRQGRVIGDYALTPIENADAEEDESVVAELYPSLLPALVERWNGGMAEVFDDAVFDTDLDGGLDAEPPTLETPADTPFCWDGCTQCLC